MGGIGKNVICQVALVVRDIIATAGHYARVFGVEVPDVRETEGHDTTGSTYRGKPTQGRAKLAFFDMGSVQLELIEPIGGPSTWQEHLDAHGEGVHHLAFRVQGMDDTVQRLESEGLELVQHGSFPGGRYAYLDASESLKVVIELLESTGK
ncbi:MAG: VOC family protein [Phycisphaerae bacterium]